MVSFRLSYTGKYPTQTLFFQPIKI